MEASELVPWLLTGLRQFVPAGRRKWGRRPPDHWRLNQCCDYQRGNRLEQHCPSPRLGLLLECTHVIVGIPVFAWLGGSMEVQLPFWVQQSTGHMNQRWASSEPRKLARKLVCQSVNFSPNQLFNWYSSQLVTQLHSHQFRSFLCRKEVKQSMEASRVQHLNTAVCFRIIWQVHLLLHWKIECSMYMRALLINCAKKPWQKQIACLKSINKRRTWLNQELCLPGSPKSLIASTTNDNCSKIWSTLTLLASYLEKQDQHFSVSSYM